MTPEPTPPHRQSAILEVTYGDDALARLVADAVSCEVDEIDDDRSRASVTLAARTVRIEVAAADLVALRAGLNTWQTLLEVGERAAIAGRR